MAPPKAVPHVAWQQSGRHLAVEPVLNAEVMGEGLQVAAAWRFSVLSKDMRRKKTLSQLKQVTSKLSYEEVKDSATLKRFHDDFFSVPWALNRTCEDAISELGSAETRRAFTVSLRVFHDDVWKKPLLYRISEIPLSELIFVRVDHVPKHDFADVNGVVGRTMFTLQHRPVVLLDNEEVLGLAPMQSHWNPLSSDNVNELKKVLKRLEKKGNGELASSLLGDLNKNNSIQTMNNRRMIRWILNRACAEGLFAPGVFDPLFQLLGCILKEYGESQVTEEGLNKLVHYQATILATVKEEMQNFHRDYSDSALKGRRAKGQYPWSADIPLVKGGLYLNVWYGCDTRKGKEFLGNRNFVVHVPLGYVFWSCTAIVFGGVI